MTADLLKQSFELVCTMENDLVTLADLLHSIARLGEIQNSADGSAIMQISWIAQKHLRSAEAAREELFHLAHPNRDHFEKAGRPETQKGDSR